jgi:hypothetical protein
LLPVTRAKVGEQEDRSAAADALPLNAATLHLDTDFELHRLSHGPGDAAVARPKRRRVMVVRTRSEVATAAGPRLRTEWRSSCEPSRRGDRRDYGVGTKGADVHRDAGRSASRYGPYGQPSALRREAVVPRHQGLATSFRSRLEVLG